MKLTPVLSKNSEKIPGFPCADSGMHSAATAASNAEDPPCLVSACKLQLNESPAERVGSVASQCSDPLEVVVLAVSNPPFGNELLDHDPSFEPHEAYPMTLLMLVKKTDVSSKEVGRPIVELRVVLAVYKSSFQNL